MTALQLLTMLRAIVSDTTIACNRQEYLPAFIYQLHNEKMQNVNNMISRNNSLNRSVKAKYFAEVRKVTLSPMKIKDYSLIRGELSLKVNTLTSAIEFMKR